jgi:hypothetical protein
VTVSRDAIESEGRRLLWGDIRQVAIEDGCLVVTPARGAVLRQRVSLIPNVEILGALVGVDPAKMRLAYR